MKVVLATEAIKSPLTGIGRYAWELASGLPNHPAVLSTRYLAYGQWKTLEQMAGNLTKENNNGTDEAIKDDGLARRLTRTRLVSYVYERLAPKLTRARLKTDEINLYHGPNYFVPKVDVPCVVTVHDLSTFANSQWHPLPRAARMNRIIVKSIANSKYIITDSRAIRTELLDYFNLSEERVVAVPLGVDGVFKPRIADELRAPLGKLGLQPGGYCLCVATMEPRKNLMRLINAYRMLPARMRNYWPLVLAGGSGWNSQAIHQATIEAAQEGWLKYLGYVPQNLLPLLYAGCRLFAYPSLYEGFGLPIAEAMASGVPVLTSNRSSMPEVAGGAAWLVEPEDEIDIYNGLQEAMEDELWRSGAVKAGRRRSAELTWEACIDRTVGVYCSALEGGEHL
ncbi:MAG: elongation factor GreAB [Peptococcaceae bacterium BRH_c8a]|nr:MAG: elongation factor GreAB [Peptococcaceae bacterium BRH_c8a]